MTKQTVAQKQAILDGMITRMNFNNRILSISEQEQVEALEYTQKERIKDLLKEFRHRELDIKLEQMQKLISLLEANPYELPQLS